ncbi:hypothetical protein LFT45_12940 [Arthrobacter sp. FW305-BF8]|uniref:hypothetical protein n=1 Tax=Arthrobacter sp. FW305-BF8 TaxID=2879617 RepID=UPI001F32CEC3|nr:hypothetical protein [Arthrobacter sp. FW305-BF8]UKA52670.1 hypothetical protein LFT45_12940 [Arthrobacter sp. FW305-BF8]
MFQLKKPPLYKAPSAPGFSLVLLVALATVTSCSAQQNAAPQATSGSAAPTETSAAASPTGSAASGSATPGSTGTAGADELCGPGSAIKFDISQFQSSPNVDNKWFPLKPGMQYTTTGDVKSAEGDIKRTVVHSITGLTKVIDGVKTQVMWDRDYADGELVESELAFLAQTNSGDVWLFGEYPEEYEGGKFTGAPATFIHSLDGAQAGIAMQTDPRTNTPSYVQAHAASVDFLDCGQVFKQNEHVCVATGCYDDVLVIDERNPLEPAAGHQRKFYSAGTGLVKVTAVGGTNQETLELAKIEQLTDAKLKEINQEALKLDQHAYQVSKNVYAKTDKAEVATETSAPASGPATSDSPTVQPGY